MRRVGVSERRAGAQVAIGRGTYRYQGRNATDKPEVRGLIRELARLRPRFGSPRLCALVRGNRERSITSGWNGSTPRRGGSCRGGARGDAGAPAGWSPGSFDRTEPALVDGLGPGQPTGWPADPGLVSQRVTRSPLRTSSPSPGAPTDSCQLDHDRPHRRRTSSSPT